jgi:hypothetical protein
LLRAERLRADVAAYRQTPAADEALGVAFNASSVGRVRDTTLAAICAALAVAVDCLD